MGAGSARTFRDASKLRRLHRFAIVVAQIRNACGYILSRLGGRQPAGAGSEEMQIAVSSHDFVTMLYSFRDPIWVAYGCTASGSTGPIRVNRLSPLRTAGRFLRIESELILQLYKTA